MKKKSIWRNTVAIHPQCFKEKNYKAKLSTSSILKKNQQKQFWKKTQKKWKKETILRKKKQKQNEKNGKKNMRGKLKLNSQLAQY
jgi:hypothetical protein